MKALIVEQNRNLLNSLARFFGSKNIDTINAFDGVIAINEFSEDVDLVIVDSEVPRISFNEVISLLKNKKKDLKVAVLLDDFIVNHENLINNKNVDQFISRPFMVDEINEFIDSLNVDKESYGMFLTYKEYKILNLLNKEDYVNYQTIDTGMYKAEEIYEYIKCLNQKLIDKEIVMTEKGLKLVDKNV